MIRLKYDEDSSLNLRAVNGVSCIDVISAVWQTSVPSLSDELFDPLE